MKRQKRKYLLLLILSVILTFSVIFLCASVVRVLTYGETEATITSVETKERKSGTNEDYYYYTESDVTCEYTINHREYSKVYTQKADYSGQEGSSITILYDKSNPYNSVIGTNKVEAVLYSALLTVGALYFIFLDIRKWYIIRKKENELRSDLSEDDIQQYEKEKQQQKTINIVLMVVSILLILPLLIIDIPLLVFAIARIIDYKMCDKICRKDANRYPA